MKDEDRLIEVMSELLAEVHEMRKEFTGEVRGLRSDIGDLRKDVNGLQKEQAITNVEIHELRLSVMRLADFGDRILRLEQEVFKKAS